MNTIIKIYKIMLLWVTALSIYTFILGFESMIVESRWILIIFWALACCVLCWLCTIFLSKRDIYIYSGTYYIDKMLK